jgi:DNA-binding NtrC family response regulator
LVVDTHEPRRRQLTAVLAGLRLEVRELADVAHLGAEPLASAALAVIGFTPTDEPSVVHALASLRDHETATPLIVIASQGSEAIAAAALRAGAKDYFSGSLDLGAFEASVRRILSSIEKHTSESPHVRARGHPTTTAGTLVSGSAPMRKIWDYLGRVATHDATVLVTGETGTGKELVASLIHELSPRRKGRFVSVNCPAIPESLLESELFGYEPGAFTGAIGRRQGLMQAANGGTMFLDEVAEMGPPGPAKILRVLETREVYRVGAKHPERLDVRFVAATNQDLEQSIADGRFRKDLYYRLAVVRVHLPPLRERQSDINALLDHYLERFMPNGGAPPVTIADDAREALQAYDWPGNVRELKNLIEAIVVMAPIHPVAVADLPEAFVRRLRSVAMVSDGERRRLLDALLAAKWNKSRAAEILHWSRMTLYRKMAKYSVVSSHDISLEGRAAR